MVEILCATPFHIFTACVLKETEYKDKEMSIILMDYFPEAREFYERLKKCGLFKHISLVEGKNDFDKYMVKVNKVFRLQYFLKSKQYIEKLGINLDEIDELLFPYGDPIILILGRRLQQLGKKCKYKYYEDGMGSYMLDMSNIRVSRFELMMGVPLRLYVPEIVYQYAPNLSDVRESIIVKRIEVPDTIDFVGKINKVFNYEKKEEIPKILVFDQIGNEEIEKESNTLCDILKECFKNKKVVIKKHPKRKDKIYEKKGFEIYSGRQGIPFEVCVLNSKQIENVVLISDSSSACFTPYIIFKYEPFIILLYKLMGTYLREEEKNRMDQIINMMKKEYQNPEKILVPETLDEVKQIINRLQWKQVDEN